MSLFKTTSASTLSSDCLGFLIIIIVLLRGGCCFGEGVIFSRMTDMTVDEEALKGNTHDLDSIWEETKQDYNFTRSGFKGARIVPEDSVRIPSDAVETYKRRCQELYAISLENNNNPESLLYYTAMIRDYSMPSHEGYRNTIELPARKYVVPLRSDTIWLVQNGCSFHGLRCSFSLGGELRTIPLWELGWRADLYYEEQSRLTSTKSGLRRDRPILADYASSSYIGYIPPGYDYRYGPALGGPH
nr:MAK10-like protein [Tanacetum cinerariifolium]